MPIPIRPVNDKKFGLFSVPYDLELNGSLKEIEIIPGQYSGTKSADDRHVFYNIDDSDKKTLYEIWDYGHNKTINASTQDAYCINSEKVYVVPDKISLSNILNLKRKGLIADKGNGLVSFTKSGEMALINAIMEQPSALEKMAIRKNKIK